LLQPRHKITLKENFEENGKRRTMNKPHSMDSYQRYRATDSNNKTDPKDNRTSKRANEISKSKM